MLKNEFSEVERKRYSNVFAAIEEKGKDINDYKKIFPYMSSATTNLIGIVVEDIRNGWSSEDIRFYISADRDEEIILYYREAYINGWEYSDRDLFLMITIIHMNTPYYDNLYKATLMALANKLPYYVVDDFWGAGLFSLVLNRNIVSIDNLLAEGYNIAQAMYLPYLSLYYSAEAVDECKKLLDMEFELDEIDKKITQKYKKKY